MPRNQKVTPSDATAQSLRPHVRRITLSRKLIYSAILMAVFLIFAGGAMEVVLRLQYSGISQITGVAEWKTTEWGGISYEWDQYDERLGWVNVPGYRSGPSVPFVVNINDQGLRGAKNYGRTPPAGLTRIAIFGDSCIFGEEVNDDETVPSHLEELLPASEVLNFGVHGYGVGQMGMLLDAGISEFNPQVVVTVILIPEDIARDNSDFMGHPKPFFALDAQNRVQARNVPVPEATRQNWFFRHSYSAAWMFGRARAPELTPSLGDQMQLLHALLKQMKTACDGRGVRYLAVPIVVAGSIERARRDPSYRQIVDMIRTSLQSSGVEILDLVGVLSEAYAREGKRMVAPIAHWSSRGNCLIAMQIAQALAKAMPKQFDKVRGDGCENAP